MSHFNRAKKKLKLINKLFARGFKREKGGRGEYSSKLVVNAWLGGCSTPFLERVAALFNRSFLVGATCP